MSKRLKFVKLSDKESLKNILNFQKLNQQKSKLNPVNNNKKKNKHNQILKIKMKKE